VVVFDDSRNRKADGGVLSLRARDAAQARRNEKKTLMQADRRAADEERLSERKQKESATMDMYVDSRRDRTLLTSIRFKAMAKQRFG